MSGATMMPSLVRTTSPAPACQPFAEEPPRPQYSPALPLPSELHEHIKIYLEERLYTQSLTLLLQTLTASVSTQGPVHIPPPNILAFIGTLAIHPHLTNEDGEKTPSSLLALHYLTHLNTIVGPINSRLDPAFKFQEPTRRTRRSAGRRSDSDRYGYDGNDDASDEQGEGYILQGRLGNEEAVWNRGLDFWNLLGWTLNCACVPAYHERWTRWKLWMDMLLQIIEADWTERLRMQHEHTGEADLGSPNTFLKDSLIVQYIGGSSSTGHGGLRRVLRAIFAEGTQRDLTEFSEVWPGERKKRKAKPAKVNTKGMNIEEGEFGDYFDSDSDSMDESDGVQIKQENEAKGKRSGSRISTGSAKKWGTRVEDEAEFIQDDSGPCEAYGGHGALMLRKRILILLTKVASALPDHFVTHNTLLDTLEESTRLLPLPVSAALFTHIQASPATSSPRFTPSTHISMLQEFTRPLLAGSGGSKSKSYFLTQQKLEDEYLPFASGSGSSAVAGGSGDVVADNAKLSLCLEAMLRLLHAETKLDSSNGRLRKAVEKGMKARRSVVDAGGGDQSKKRKVDGDDGVNQALQTFNACQARMKVLLIMIERSGND